MRLKTLIMAAVAAAILHLPAFAQDSVEERLSRMEQRIKYLEERVAAQDRAIVEKDRQISSLTAMEDAWFNGVEIGGVIEVEAYRAGSYDGNSETNADVSTVELGVAAEMHDWVGAEVVLLYDDEEDLNVDTATLTVGPPDGPWSFTAGQYTLPFGTYETNLVSDPLPLEIGETGETAIEFGVEFEGVQGSVFAFNGANDRGGDNRISSIGAAASYSVEYEDSAFGVNASWINDLGESDNLEEIAAGDKRVAGWTASGFASLGGVSLLGEYLTAAREFREEDFSGAEPSSYALEVAYEFEVGGKGVTAAAGYQRSEEAIALELPESRYLVGLSVDLVEGVALGVEWKRDNDYGEADGGTGKDFDTFTALLSAEF